MEKLKSFFKKMSRSFLNESQSETEVLVCAFPNLRRHRQVQGAYRDIDYVVVESPCLHSNLTFGKPKYLAVH